MVGGCSSLPSPAGHATARMQMGTWAPGNLSAYVTLTLKEAEQAVCFCEVYTHAIPKDVTEMDCFLVNIHYTTSYCTMSIGTYLWYICTVHIMRLAENSGKCCDSSAGTTSDRTRTVMKSSPFVSYRMRGFWELERLIWLGMLPMEIFGTFLYYIVVL